MFTLVFIVSFPPLIGFSALAEMTGMIYGMKGWPLIAISSVVGSTVAFLVFQKWLSSYSVKLINKSENLKIFTSVLNDSNESYLQNLFVMTLIRLSPLPYSLSNGALGAVPDLDVWMFALASGIASPKLFISLFIGAQMKKMGQEKSGMDQIVDLLTILITVGVIGTVYYVLYNLMKKFNLIIS
ncbi:unnamed protein product [Ambrosiozyma monospora]|uniref:Unnamed protein product n=1 Tax=Ambrosiozyma monospora TaxID=43982 RepID=A0ACB5UCZ5_AMBMO|nr:unnamed protein product [Ambrosiozyma monospora]